MRDHLAEGRRCHVAGEDLLDRWFHETMEAEMTHANPARLQPMVDRA